MVKICCRRNWCIEEHNQRVSISILQGKATARHMQALLASWSTVVRHRRATAEAVAMRLAEHYIQTPFVAWREAAVWWGRVRHLTASALALYTSHSQTQVRRIVTFIVQGDLRVVGGLYCLGG